MANKTKITYQAQLLIIFFALTGCNLNPIEKNSSTTVSHGVRRPQYTATLNCEEAIDASIFLTKETSDIFNGIELAKNTEKAKTFCGKPQTVSNCSQTSGNRYCKTQNTIAGIQTDEASKCKNNGDCLIGYSMSHPKDCDAFADEPPINTVRSISGKGLKNVCLFSQAFIRKDTSPCEKIDQITSLNANSENIYEHYWNRNKCLWGVSDHTNNVTICENMLAPEGISFEKDLCFMSYALKNKDKSFCQNVTWANGWQYICLNYDSLSTEEKAQGLLYISPSQDADSPIDTKNLATENCPSFPPDEGPITLINYYVCYDDKAKSCYLKRIKPSEDIRYETSHDHFGMDGKTIAEDIKTSGGFAVSPTDCSTTTEAYFNSIVKK